MVGEFEIREVGYKRFHLTHINGWTHIRYGTFDEVVEAVERQANMTKAKHFGNSRRKTNAV